MPNTFTNEYSMKSDCIASGNKMACHCPGLDYNAKLACL
jgi:hypothetical protein